MSKKLGEKPIIGILVIIMIVLSALLAVSAMNCLSKMDDAFEEGFYAGVAYAEMIVPIYEPLELDPFLEHVRHRIIYVLNVEPMIVIDLPTIESRSVIYNVTFYKLTKEEINQSVEIWKHNHSEYTKYMVFDLAFGNNRKPVAEKTLVDIYYMRHNWGYYSVIYYEKIV